MFLQIFKISPMHDILSMFDLALSLSMTIISQCSVYKAISGGKLED